VPVPFREVRLALPFTARPADLVHTHSTGPVGMTGFRAAAAWDVPLVTTWHTDLLAYADLFAEIPVARPPGQGEQRRPGSRRGVLSCRCDRDGTGRTVVRCLRF
jgi:hypothetical protein